jgi:6-phosphogluconate dehydrogenase
MQLGMVGLGRMGGNMARRLRRGGIDVAAYNREFAQTERLAQETGLVAAESIDTLIGKLDSPRVIWLMLPAGDITQQHIDDIAVRLAPGDIIVDGANSLYKESIVRGRALAEHNIRFIDAGVSGGVWGLDEGYALMVGGEPEAVAQIEPALKILAPAPDKGWLHCGPVGSGHFVKMIHNGIEYGMMQAFAEGFALMKGREEFDLDLAKISEMWRHGSVVRSWLLDLTASFLARDQELTDVEAFVADSGEGRWTVMEAIEQGIPAPVISLALSMRFASQGQQDYSSKILAKMREAFGGHAIKTR